VRLVRAVLATTLELPRHRWLHPDGREVSVYGGAAAPVALTPEGLREEGGLHLRHDVLLDEWVAVTPRRAARPGGRATSTPATAPESTCPLCPGGVELPFAYRAASLENRFPTFAKGAPRAGASGRGASTGACEVVVFTPRHDASFGELDATEAGVALAVLCDRSSTLSRGIGVRYVLAFENAGAAVGATLEHPHGQIYAFPVVPPAIARRADVLHAHRSEHGTCLHCSVTNAPSGGDRRVLDDAHFEVGVPFAPRWPYEVHIRARRHGLARLDQLESHEQQRLAVVLAEVRARLDRVLGVAMPVMTCVLEAPAGCRDWHVAVELYPVLRDRDRLKIRASVETATGLVILDRLPEETAAELREVMVPPPLDVPVVRVVHAGEGVA
jgi:UDPglucose--hexose-1-phosphate uridylyltransferase